MPKKQYISPIAFILKTAHMFQSGNVRSIKQMSRLKNRLISFFRGRYGTDSLNAVLLDVYFLLLLINMFIPNFIITVFMWIILVWSLFRSLSQNIYARQRENNAFLQFWRRLVSFIALYIRRIREFKTHRYRRCKQCKVILLLPRIIG